MGSGKKFSVYGEWICIDQMPCARDTTQRLFVGGFDDFNRTISVNPEVIKSSNSGIKPKPNPFPTEHFPIFFCDREPVVRYQHDVRNLPLSQLASMPQPSSVSIPDRINEIFNIKESEFFPDHAVMFFPVFEKTVADAFGIFLIGWRLVQETVSVICRVAERARHGEHAFGCRHMCKDTTSVWRSITAANEHGLLAHGTSRPYVGPLTKILPKLLWSDSGISIWMKCFFHVRVCQIYSNPCAVWCAAGR